LKKYTSSSSKFQHFLQKKETPPGYRRETHASPAPWDGYSP